MSPFSISRVSTLGLLLLVLLLLFPPFLCMELHSDTLLFDVYARNLQRGGILYRDGCETNLPGMIWLHLGIRSIVGWRSEALRAVDLAVVGSIIALLSCWFRPRRTDSLIFASALLVFYLTQSEWCHCQRD